MHFSDSDEELQQELEALLAIHGNAVTRYDSTRSLAVSVAPRIDGQLSRAYVGADLLLGLPNDYPAQEPRLNLRNVFGLRDSRRQQLLDHLRREARGLVGDVMLCSLCEAAISWLDDNNWPDGVCTFCLERLFDDSSGVADLVRLPCNHYFHSGCWWGWWRWQQGQYKAAEQQLVSEHGGDNHLVRCLLAKQLPSQEGGVYTVQCPSCRVSVTAHDLVPWQHHKPVPDKAVPTCGSGSRSIEAALPQEVLTEVRGLQRQFAQLMSRQKANNGLIDPSQRLSVPSATATSAVGETEAPGRQGPSHHEKENGRGRGRRRPRRRHPSPVRYGQEAGERDGVQETGQDQGRGAGGVRGRAGRRGAGRGKSEHRSRQSEPEEGAVTRAAAAHDGGRGAATKAARASEGGKSKYKPNAE